MDVGFVLNPTPCPVRS